MQPILGVTQRCLHALRDIPKNACCGGNCLREGHAARQIRSNVCLKQNLFRNDFIISSEHQYGGCFHR